ncbi:hypothetical protein Pan216_20800 [Planctomycetes bacterium Pan216]|uniref:Uncharacterized protein n=1 Tax=Kolteria novifilia TaxID=2527975 RepID=A0A518B2R9_9BACT|nr:hypothetical protein Pan216_20800 [Planctomycetes bacterium Pan216]
MTEDAILDQLERQLEAMERDAARIVARLPVTVSGTDQIHFEKKTSIPAQGDNNDVQVAEFSDEHENLIVDSTNELPVVQRPRFRVIPEGDDEEVTVIWLAFTVFPIAMATIRKIDGIWCYTDFSQTHDPSS